MVPRECSFPFLVSSQQVFRGSAYSLHAAFFEWYVGTILYIPRVLPYIFTFVSFHLLRYSQPRVSTPGLLDVRRAFPVAQATRQKTMRELTNEIPGFPWIPITTAISAKVNFIILTKKTSLKKTKLLAQKLLLKRPRAVLKTKGTAFPNTDRPRTANNIYLFCYKPS